MYEYIRLPQAQAGGTAPPLQSTKRVVRALPYMTGVRTSVDPESPGLILLN